MDFVIWTWFFIWALAFELYLSFASMRQSPGPHGFAKTNGKPTKRIVRTLTTESAGGNRLTYEKELLNSRKHSNFYKTNHPGFPTSVRQPPSLVKTNGKPTKRIVCTLRGKCAEGNRLTYEKEPSNSWETSHSYKTNHPGFPHALPPYDPNNNIFCIFARNDRGKLLSNTRFPPALRSVICLFEAQCRARSTCLASVQSAIMSGD